MTTDGKREPDPYEGLDPLARQVAQREDEEIMRKPDPPSDRVERVSIPEEHERQRREAETGVTKIDLSPEARQ